MVDDPEPSVKKGVPASGSDRRAGSRFAVSWLKKAMPLSRQARIVSPLLPAGARFRFALAMSRLQGRAVREMGGNEVLTKAAMLEHWLWELTQHSRFPIPMRVRGQEVLDQYALRGPVMYYTLHLAMSDMPLRMLVERGYPVPVPIADAGRMVQGSSYPVTGMNVRIPALVAGPHVLQRVRTLLLAGRSIACMADRGHPDNMLHANPLRLTARLRVPVIYMWAVLAADGVVDVIFQPAPHPFCESNAAIEKNLDFLRELQDVMMRSVGLSPLMKPGAQPAPARASVAKAPSHSQTAWQAAEYAPRR